MKYNVDFGRKRQIIDFKDHIVYSTVKDLNGEPLALEMSLMMHNGNSELKAAAGYDDSETIHRKPVIIWLSGGGYRGVDNNMMIGETQFLADAGFCIASVYYRSSAQGHFPAQLIDVKTAIRFLRAHANEYNLDPNRIGVMGRSAGGHLSTMAGINLEGYDSEEWASYSSDIQAVYNMFGPMDLLSLLEKEEKDIKNNPNHRWKCVEESHGGVLFGGKYDEVMKEKAIKASPTYLINEKTRMAPLLMMHGDSDNLIPYQYSDEFYNKLVENGFGSQSDYYLIKNAGHGSPEFFQDETKKIVLHFFCKNLGVQIKQ